MSQNSILLKAFNKHLFEFIDEVIKVFPEKSEIVSSRDYLDTLKKNKSYYHNKNLENKY